MKIKKFVGYIFWIRFSVYTKRTCCCFDHIEKIQIYTQNLRKQSKYYDLKHKIFILRICETINVKLFYKKQMKNSMIFLREYKSVSLYSVAMQDNLFVISLRLLNKSWLWPNACDFTLIWHVYFDKIFCVRLYRQRVRTQSLERWKLINTWNTSVSDLDCSAHE